MNDAHSSSDTEHPEVATIGAVGGSRDDPKIPCPECENEVVEVVANEKTVGYTCYECRILWYGVADVDIRKRHPDTDRHEESDSKIVADGGNSRSLDAATDQEGSP